MATVSNYTFNNLSRIGDDQCGITGRDQQNNEFGTYSTTNYFANWCGMKKPIEFATSQPNIFYNGGYGNYCGAGGCNINSDSKLKIGSIQTHPKCRISLYQRPFATVPFLGRGPPRPVIESRLQQGSYNPANLVEGVAANGWIRGGLPSREISRDREYLSRHN